MVKGNLQKNICCRLNCSILYSSCIGNGHRTRFTYCLRIIYLKNHELRIFIETVALTGFASFHVLFSNNIR
jgi:hypothetical protein